MAAWKSSIAKFFFKRILPEILSYACPPRIPRSGREGASVNCYSIFIDKNQEPYLLVKNIKKDTLHCIKWNGAEYKDELDIFYGDVNFSEMVIIHCCGLNDFKYINVNDFIISYYTRYPYILSYFTEKIGNIDQYFFNKKKIVTKRRMDLLKFLSDYSNETGNDIDMLTIMAKLYTKKWILHPGSNVELRKLELYLAALEENGEVERKKDGYKVKGKALLSIEEYEEQERKHTDNIKIQRKLFWLTILIAFLAAIQAQIIKIPIIIDLTQK